MTNPLDPIKIFRELHEMPELAMQEFRTSAYLADHLEALGYEVQRGVGGTTGVVGVVKGAEEGPVVLLRADMDALPFVIDGKKCAIHACGHDSHSAVVLAAASRLKDQVKKGVLKILFQPAEEACTGAIAMFEAGVLDDVDYALGAHIRPKQDLPFGTMCSGISHVAATTLKVDITGRLAHGARPHLGINALEVGCQVVNAVSSLWFDPTNAWSIKCTQFHSDVGASNSIPDKCTLTFDVRAGTNEVAFEIQRRMERAIKGCAEGLGASVELDWVLFAPAKEYDAEFKAEVAEAIKEVLGDDGLRPDCGGGGEDFHHFKLKKPSLKAAYFGIGSGAAPGLHAADMSFDPAILPKAVDVMEKVVLKHLG